MMEAVISWIFVFIRMLQDYLVDHDRTAGSLGFKEVFLVPLDIQNQNWQQNVETFSLTNLKKHMSCPQRTV